MRLVGFDYINPNSYFITVCTQDRAMLFGDVHGGQMRQIAAGKMLEYWWSELPNRFPNAGVGEFIVMPDHIHGIIEINMTGNRGPDGLTSMLNWFKTMTSNAYIRNVKAGIMPGFNKRLWQRGYYERIIRSDNERQHIALYIRQNPQQLQSRERM